MDLVDFSQSTFEEIVADYTEFAQSIGIEDFTAIPISGFKGDNITALSANTLGMGAPLMHRLETVNSRKR